MERKLKDWLTGFLSYTYNSEPPEAFRTWAGISTIAGALQRKCFADHGDLRIYPNMYIVLCGPPAARKGTALSFVTNFLYDANIKVCADSTTKESLIQEIQGAMETSIIEGSSKTLTHSSYSIVSPELTVLLGRKNPELMDHLTDWFDGGKGRDGIWEYRTKGSGQYKIHGIWVNLLGATTPEMMNTLPVEARGGGFTSRIVFVHEDKAGKVIAIPKINNAMKDLRETLMADLEVILATTGSFEYTDSFYKVYGPWYERQAIKPPLNDPNLIHYCNRRGIHILKLSMIMCASRKDNNRQIIGKDFLRATSLLHAAERNMHKVFSLSGESPMAKVLTRVVRDIGTVKKIRKSVLIARYMRDLPDIEKGMEAVLMCLKKAKFIKMKELADGDVEVVMITEEIII